MSRACGSADHLVTSKTSTHLPLLSSLQETTYNFARYSTTALTSTLLHSSSTDMPSIVPVAAPAASTPLKPDHRIRNLRPLTEYKIDPTYGFLPPQEPLRRLPHPYYEPWERAADDFNGLLLAGALRKRIHQVCNTTIRTTRNAYV